MARRPRFNLPGVSQHVIQRGNNRTPCFFAETDFEYYLVCLADSARKYNCLIHAYVLMTNHVHLLLTPHADYAISQLMQSLGRKYVRYINDQYQRTGTLWEGRYKASLVDSENYLFTCMRYIEMNPVRANMTNTPGEYKWSSFHANGFGKEDGCVSPHDLYVSLGADTNKRTFAYQALFYENQDRDQIHKIRKALNQELVLGNRIFKLNIEKITQRKLTLGVPGRPNE